MTSTPSPFVADLTALKSRLDRAVTGDGLLDLTATLLPASDLATFVATAPDQRIRLTKPTITLNGAGVDQRLDIDGDMVGRWSVPNLGGGQLSQLSFSIRYTQPPPSGGQPGVAFVSTVVVRTGRLALAGASLPLTGTLASGGAVLGLSIVGGGAGGDAPSMTALMTALAGPRAASSVPAQVVALNALGISAGEVRFGFAANATTITNLTALCQGDWTIIDGGLFALRQVGVTLWASQTPGNSGSIAISSSSCFTATTDLCGLVVTATLHLTPGRQWRLTLAPPKGVTLPSLADIAGFVGGSGVRSAVEAGLKAVGLGDITVTSTDAVFDMKRRRLTTMQIGGRIGFAGVVLNASVQMPEFRFQAHLPYGPGVVPPVIALDRVAAECLGETADLPSLTISRLSLLAAPGDGSYSVSVTTEQNWDWRVGGPGGPVLTLEQVGATLAREPGSVSGSLSVATRLGGVDIDLAASYLGKGAGWIFFGSVSTGAIDLGTMVGDLARQLGGGFPDALVAAIGGLTIDSLSVMADSKSGTFQFTSDVTVTGTLPFGDVSYDLATRAFITSATDPATGRRGYVGNLEADLEIGNALFTLTYDFGPSPSIIAGRWRAGAGESIGVQDLLDAFGIDAILTVPDGLDLGLTSVSFDYHTADKRFTISAESRLFGDAFITIGKDARGKWGVVFGVDIPARAKLSAIPGIGSAFAAADRLTFTRMAVMLSSATLPNYTPPALPGLPAPTPSSAFPPRLQAGRSPTPTANGVTLQLPPGLSLAAALDFATSGANDPSLRNMQGLVGVSELVMQATANASGVSLFIGLDGKIGIPTGTGSRLTLGNASLAFTMSLVPVYQMSGALGFRVFGTPVEATARLMVAPTQAQVSLSVSSSAGSLPSPPGMKGLHMRQFGVMMGVFFEPPGLDLGLQGRFQIGNETALRDDEFAIVLQVIEEVPNILYLSFYVDEMSLGRLVTLFTDRSAPDLIAAMDIVKASQLSFYWCEAPVALPDGSVGLPGFGVSARIRLFSLGGHMELSINTSQGISGTAELAPITIGNALSIAGDGKGRTRTYQQRDGVWAEVANNAVVRNTPALPTRREVLVAPGGPVVAFNCLSSPFLRASWRISLFDIVKQMVEVTIGTSTISFALTYQVAGIEKFDLACALADGLNFSASGQCRIGINAMIGPIHVGGVDCGRLRLQTLVVAGLSVALTPARFSLEMVGSFAFMGLSYAMPKLALAVAPASLAELPPKLVQIIADNADALFRDLFRDAAAWARMVADGVMTEVANIGSVLKNAYGLSAEAAAGLLKSTGFAVATVAGALKDVYGQTAAAAATALKAAGYTAAETTGALKQTYSLYADAAAAALKAAGYAVNDVTNALKTGYGLTSDAAAAVLRGMGYAATDTANALKAAYGLSSDAAAAALKAVGYASNDIANALKQGYGMTAEATATALKKLGFSVDETGAAIKAAYAASSDAVAKALNTAGYTAEQTGNYLKTAFNMSSDALNKALSSAGFSSKDVGGYLNKAGGELKKVGKKLDPRRW